ncbi:MAG: hypothetical protein V2J08_06930 [Desulfotignum sp.]|jgi:hypothetical protein|nr:hypothetical protein [Desulfotignum sp.]
MVNIHHIQDTNQPIKTPQGGPEKTGKKDAFKSALTQALDKAEPSETPETTTHGLGEITPTRTIQIPEQADLVSSSTEKLLGLLETYAAQLQDPGVSLKHMAPVLETIHQRADQLVEETRTLGSDHAGLRDIATQTAVAAQTEYIKFQRGDYLS